MKKISDREFGDFLANKPLYYKIIVVENFTGYKDSAYINHDDFRDKSFKFVCPNENEDQTFRTELIKGDYPRLVQKLREGTDQLPDTFDEISQKLDLKIHLQGICQSCRSKVDFLIRVTSDKEWEKRNEGINISVQKIGQFPAYDIGLDSYLKKYLSVEDQSNYKKALVCLSISYGIGAYSYLRRVIENEIKRIIKDISELEFEGVNFVKKAFEDFQKDFQMSKLIDVINKYLPSSLKEMGDNPIRLLYEQLSGGIHEFTDEECVEKSQSK